MKKFQKKEQTITHHYRNFGAFGHQRVSAQATPGQAPKRLTQNYFGLEGFILPQAQHTNIFSCEATLETAQVA